MGLEKIRSVSKQGPYELQVELRDGAGQKLPVARYGFQLDGEEAEFALHLEDEAASPPMLTGRSGIPFSTVDRDHDLAVDVNCAKLLSGMTPPSTPEQRDDGTQTSDFYYYYCFFKSHFCCRRLVVQQLWRLEPQRQISQKAERTEPKAAEDTRGLLDDTGTKALREDHPAEDRPHRDTRLIKEQLTRSVQINGRSLTSVTMFLCCAIVGSRLSDIYGHIDVTLFPLQGHFLKYLQSICLQNVLNMTLILDFI